MNEFDDDDNSVVEHKNRSQTRQEWEIQKKKTFLCNRFIIFIWIAYEIQSKKKKEKKICFVCHSFGRKYGDS